MQAVHVALGRAGLGRFRQQAFRQRVVRRSQPCRKVELAFQVPDALARFQHGLRGPVALTGRSHLGRDVLQGPGERSEHAQAARIHDGGGVLEGLDQFRLAFGDQRVGLFGNTHHFG